MSDPDDLLADRLLSTLPLDNDGRPVLGGVVLLRKLGAGGMGAVYLGLQPELKREVAVKILPFNLAEQEPSIVGRFLVEARLAASLDSPHVVRVLDVGCENETHYLVMQYVPGESAGALLRRHREKTGGGLPRDVVLRLGIAAARGLAAAHAAGIVHRDVKPDNLLVPGDRIDDAKLADLGLAKPEGGSTTAGTLSHVAMGTPGYMAPEQAENAKAAGPPADVFAFGATLYALATGQPPFRSNSLLATMRAAAVEEPAPLPPSLGPGLVSLIQRCLQKNPKARYPDGAALLKALERVRRDPKGAEFIPTLRVAPRRRAVPLVLAGAGILLAIVAILATRGGSPTAPDPTTTPPPVAASATPSPLEDLLARAARLEAQDRLDDALAALTQAAVLAPDDPRIVEAKRRISGVLAGREDAAGRDRRYVQFRETYEQLLLKAGEPATWDPVIEAAKGMEANADTHARKTEAAALLRKAREGRGDAVAQFEARTRDAAATAARKRERDALASRARAEEDPAKAIELWKRVEELADDSGERREARGRILDLESKLASGAREQEFRARLAEGREALEAGNWEDARRRFEEALVLRADDPEALKGLAAAKAGPDKDPYAVKLREGLAALKRGEWTQARAAFEAALARRPGDPEASAGLAEAARHLAPAKIVQSGSKLELVLDDKVRLKFVQVPAGTYPVGEGDTARNVTLLHPFWIATTETTQALWEALQEGPGWTAKDPELPATGSSWSEVNGWLVRLGDRTPGWVPQLPTEAQWEVACRSASRIPVPDEPVDRKLRKVGERKPNALGLHDMLGNASEFCSDWFWPKPDLLARVDPTGGLPSKVKVLRGGSYQAPVERLGPTLRGSINPQERMPFAGFRIVLTPGFHPRLRPETKTVFLDDAKKVPAEFVHLPAGAFLMGAPEDGREIVLRQDFWMQATELTRAQWEAVMGPAKFGGVEPALPASGVTWTETQDYLRRVAPRLNFGRPGLPTEAEWEYACRAGTRTTWSWGADASVANEYGVFYGGKGLEPVAGRKPNPWRLHDLHGNAMEWCQDWFAELPKGQFVDPKGPTSGMSRVLRGGWAGFDPKDAASAARSSASPVAKEAHIGFRLVVR